MPGVRIEFPHEAPAGPHLRALRADAERPFALIEPGGGDYEVLVEEGDVDGSGGVLAIADAEAGGAGAQGYLGRRVYRATGARGPRLIELARWSSPLMVARARSAGSLTADPVLYLPVG